MLPCWNAILSDRLFGLAYRCENSGKWHSLQSGAMAQKPACRELRHNVCKNESHVRCSFHRIRMAVVIKKEIITRNNSKQCLKCSYVLLLTFYLYGPFGCIIGQTCHRSALMHIETFRQQLVAIQCSVAIEWHIMVMYWRFRLCCDVVRYSVSYV